MTSGIPRLRFASFVATMALAITAAAQPPAPPSRGEAPSTTVPTKTSVRANSVLDEISGNLVVGPGWFDAGDLDDRLRAHGFDEVDAQVVLLGLSGRIILDNGIALGAGGAILGHSAVEGTGPYDATLGYNALRGEAGYALLHTNRWLLLPKLALGAYATTLTLSDDREATFDELLEGPGTTTAISSRGFLLGALLDFAFRVAPGAADNDARGFFSVGVEGGYLYSVPLSRWRTGSGTDVDDGPDAPLTGGFVGVTLGGGVLDL